jgi:geranylgeranylglycerol-phosphate geranylgeranyltransferase
MKKFFNYFYLIRPINCLITLLTVFVGGIVIADSTFELKTLLLASISASLIAAGGNVINDIYDIELDKIVHPKRPLPSGSISITSARYFYFGLNIIALFLISQTNYLLFIISLIVVILLFFYASLLKKKFLLSNLTIAFLTGLTFVFAGVAVNNPEMSLIPASFAFLINLIREIVKDTEDLEGDVKFGINSVPNVLGLSKTKLIVWVLIFILFLITILPFIFSAYKIEYFVLIMIIVNPLLVYSGKLFFQHKNNNEIKKVSNLLKLNMILGLIAIYFGK